MREIVEWLGSRRPPIPPPMAREMETALARSGRSGAIPASVADRLAGAGLDALARVLSSSQDRRSAPELLAADALLTHAFEAAAEAGPDALDRLASDLGEERFERLLEREGS